MILMVMSLMNFQFLIFHLFHISGIGDEQRNIVLGINSWDTVGYRGMCPPKDIIHNRKISIYALNIKIEDCQNCSKIV